jgi:hypothetical protein
VLGEVLADIVGVAEEGFLTGSAFVEAIGVPVIEYILTIIFYRFINIYQ